MALDQLQKEQGEEKAQSKVEPAENRSRGPLTDDDVVLFLSARAHKIREPLLSVGFNPTCIICEGGLNNMVKDFFALIKALKETPQAAILTDTPDYVGFVPWLAAKIMGRKLIYRSRGDSIRECKTEQRVARLIFNKYFFFPSLAGVIPVSGYLKKRVIEQFPKMDPKKIIPVNLPEPANKKAGAAEGGAKSETKKILIVTKFYFYDKIRPLFRIIPLLDRFMEENPGYEVIILGDGPYKKRIEEKIKRTKNGEKFIFAGFVQNPEEFYAESFCLLHTSELDGYPSVIDEARVNGLPVVCSRTVSLVEMVEDGRDGLLLAEGMTDIGDALKKLEREELYDAIVENSRRRLRERNDAKVIGRKFMEAMERILGMTQTPPVPEQRKSRKPKVAYMIKRIDKMGGSERQLISLISGLSKQVDNQIFCFSGGDGLPEDMTASGTISYVRFKGFTVVNTLKTARFMAREFRRLKIDLAFAYGFEASFIGVLAARLAGVPFVSARRELAHWRKLRHLIAFSVINLLSKRITANSRAVVRVTLKEPFSRGRVRLIRNGLAAHQNGDQPSCALPPNPASGKVIGCIANLRQVKNIKMLVDAAPAVLEKSPGAVFWIVGEGPERTPLENRIKSLGLENNVFLIGPRNDINALLKRMDIVALTSIAEGSSNAILEAMGAGKPVVVTNVGGLPEAIINNQTGYIVDVNDTAALAEKISRLLTDDNLSREMGEQAKERVLRHYNPDRLYYEHLALFDQLLYGKD